MGQVSYENSKKSVLVWSAQNKASFVEPQFMICCAANNSS